MAILVDADRESIKAEIMQDFSSAQEPCGITKADLRAAINAADDWANANAVNYNSALPLPARTVLTAAQKARLLMHVVRKRWLSGV